MPRRRPGGGKNGYCCLAATERSEADQKEHIAFREHIAFPVECDTRALQLQSPSRRRNEPPYTSACSKADGSRHNRSSRRNFIGVGSDELAQRHRKRTRMPLVLRASLRRIAPASPTEIHQQQDSRAQNTQTQHTPRVPSNVPDIEPAPWKGGEEGERGGGRDATNEGKERRKE